MGSFFSTSYPTCPLFSAIEAQNYEQIESQLQSLSLSANSDLCLHTYGHSFKDLTDSNGNSPLHHIAMLNTYDEKIVNKVLEYEFSYGQNNMGLTPLHLAIMKAPKETVEQLLNYMAKRNVGSVTELDSIENTPLHTAAIRGDMDILRLIYQMIGEKDPKQANNQNTYGKIPANLSKTQEVLAYLLERYVE